MPCILALALLESQAAMAAGTINSSLAPFSLAGSLAKASGPAVRRMEYGICNVTYANLSDSSQAERDDRAAWRNRLNPIGYAYEVWSKKRHEEFFGVDRGQAKDFEWLAKWEKSLKVSVLRAPAHGKLVQVDRDAPMLFTPDVDYLGTDRVDLLVTGNDDLGHPFALTLRYHINVVGRESGPGLNATKHPDSKELCGRAKYHWRISELDSQGETYRTAGSDNVARWLRSAQLSNLIASARKKGPGSN